MISGLTVGEVVQAVCGSGVAMEGCGSTSDSFGRVGRRRVRGSGWDGFER